MVETEGTDSAVEWSRSIGSLTVVRVHVAAHMRAAIIPRSADREPLTIDHDRRSSARLWTVVGHRRS